MSESGFKPSPRNMVGSSPLYQALSQEEGHEAQRGYLAQGHMNIMAEPGLRAQVCLASKCMLPTSPHLTLWLLKYFILPFRNKFRYTSFSVSVFSLSISHSTLPSPLFSPSPVFYSFLFSFLLFSSFGHASSLSETLRKGNESARGFWALTSFI